MDGGQKNLGLCEKALPSNFCSLHDDVFDRLWVHPSFPHSPTPPSNVVAKKALISTQFAQNLILFGVGGEGSLVLLISLETKSLNTFDSIAA